MRLWVHEAWGEHRERGQSAAHVVHGRYERMVLWRTGAADCHIEALHSEPARRLERWLIDCNAVDVEAREAHAQGVTVARVSQSRDDDLERGERKRKLGGRGGAAYDGFARVEAERLGRP